MADIVQCMFVTSAGCFLSYCLGWLFNEAISDVIALIAFLRGDR